MSIHTQHESVPQRGSDEEARWNAVMRRDAAADGRFFYAVLSTGVYCRPSCASRRPRRENVRFYASAAAAERAGFRACKRCKPQQASLDEQHRAKVLEACRLIEVATDMTRLDALAATAGMSRYHFHRVFKKFTGLTPRGYAAAQRSQRVREQLSKQRTVTAAIYGAGYNSSGRFYADSAKTLGMTPTELRRGGAHTRIRFAVGQCSLGAILVAATDKGVCAILLGDEPEALLHDLQERFPRAELLGGDAEFEQLVAKVVALVEKPSARLDLDLDLRGTAFQQRVWQALQKIPPGKTLSYTELAERIGAPKAVRAVARACASNAIAVAIPCHRVIRTDGGLSGYRWGIERKRALLERERKR